MVKKKILSGFISLVMTFGSVNALTANYYVKAADTKSVLEVGQKEFGFTLTEEKKVDNFGSTGYLYTHDKTGGKVLFLKNEDKNRFFNIIFKTPPKDNTGVNHIIEHSVFCGSKKYPVKDVFKTMLNQSVITYMNASTSNDFTTFPVASKNAKTFNNLVDIYLDAVFNPNVLNNRKIFDQEGWHYEINQKGDLEENGTVLNEMKGRYDGASESMDTLTAKSLFPNTDFVNDSGGNPENIPSLTYEKLVDTYKKNYTPSNALIIVYGDVDMDTLLNKIDGGYFSKYKKTKQPEIKIAQKLRGKKKEITYDYGVQLGSDTAKKTIFLYNYVVSTKFDNYTDKGINYLSQLLFGNQNSKLQTALSNAGLATQVYGMARPIGPYTIYQIQISDGEYKDKAKIDKVVNDTFAQIAKEGFSKEQLEGLFNSNEMGSKGSQFSDDMIPYYYDFLIVPRFLYGGDLLYSSSDDDVTKSIKDQALNNKYFEKLLTSAIVNNKNVSEIIYKPVAGLTEKQNAESAEKLKQKQLKMTAEQIKAIDDNAKALLAWKNEPDSKEALATIPVLNKEDIDVNVVDTPTKVDNIDGIKVLNHPISTDGVAYMKFYFDMSNLSPQEKIDLNIFSNIFTRLNTKTKKYTDLNNEINLYTGGISAAPSVMSVAKSNYYVQKEVLSMACLNDKMDTSMNLLNELINETQITEDLARIKEIVNQDAIGLTIDPDSLVPSLVKENVLDRISPFYKLVDESTGRSYMEYLLSMIKKNDFNWNDELKRLEDIRKKVFNKNNLVIGFTGDESEYKNFKDSLSKFTSSLSNDNVDKTQETQTVSSGKNTAIKTNEKVMFTYLGGSYKSAGYEYNPKMRVLQKILDSYLWDKVRIVGGAYGAQSIIDKDGVIAFSSHRDPKLKETLDAFKGVPDYIKNYKCSDQELTNLIIGALGNSDYFSLAPSVRGSVADQLYMTNKTYDDVRKEYSDILTTQLSDINSFADMLKSVIDQNCYSVSGNQDLITQNQDLFSEITTIDELLSK